MTPRQGLTFAVSHVCVEFETGLAQAQEGAVGVDAPAVETHVVFAALIHVCENIKKKTGEKKEKPVMRDNWRIRGVKIYYKLINAKHPHLSCAFIRSAGNNPPFLKKKRKKESAIKPLSEHKMHRAFPALNRTLANRKTKWNIKQNIDLSSPG